jgi:hypothetical protein
MRRRTPSLFIPALRYFDGLTSSFNARSARCIGFQARYVLSSHRRFATPPIEHNVVPRARLVESKHCVRPVTQPTHSTDRRHPPNRRFLVRKLQSPKLSPSQFEPELVWTMRSVLDSAVDQIDAANRTPATKAKMAERIVRVASDGITDPRTLTGMAIEDGMQPAD